LKTRLLTLEWPSPERMAECVLFRAERWIQVHPRANRRKAAWLTSAQSTPEPRSARLVRIVFSRARAGMAGTAGGEPRCSRYPDSGLVGLHWCRRHLFRCQSAVRVRGRPAGHRATGTQRASAPTMGDLGILPVRLGNRWPTRDRRPERDPRARRPGGSGSAADVADRHPAQPLPGADVERSGVGTVQGNGAHDLGGLAGRRAGGGDHRAAAWTAQQVLARRHESATRVTDPRQRPAALPGDRASLRRGIHTKILDAERGPGQSSADQRARKCRVRSGSGSMP
jgi:hypothetical protein